MADNTHDEQRLALFIDFENIAIGVRDAHYRKFNVNLVLERLLEGLLQLVSCSADVLLGEQVARTPRAGMQPDPHSIVLVDVRDPAALGRCLGAEDH